VRPGEGSGAHRRIDADVLAEHPLDVVTGDKDDRGSVVVIGGEPETAGAPVLTALAALRAGAGRAHVITDAQVATALAVATPELRVSGLPGGSAPELGASPSLPIAIRRADAIVVGTGCTDRARVARLLHHSAPLVSDDAVLLVDAAALPLLADDPGVLAGLGARAVLVPNPGEAARVLGRSLDAVEANPVGALVDTVDRLGATVAIRGRDTWIAAPGDGPFVECDGSSALGTAGSGDVLAGVVAGLAAGGATPIAALLWGVRTHAAAGAALAQHHGGVGLLARELLDVLPRELNALRGASAPTGPEH
jgi:hydroxyethylthiazole kinase-like uncharacterized protein yjeF